MFLLWQERRATNLLTSIHLVDSGLIDDSLHGSSVRSMKDLGLSKYIVLSMTLTRGPSFLGSLTVATLVSLSPGKGRL